jgi:ubiquinone/menaquinone biosynthesis C-methylase UbiE
MERGCSLESAPAPSFTVTTPVFIRSPGFITQSHESNMVPAAVVGKTGRVYAADKEKEALRKIKRRARRAEVENLRAVHMPDGRRIPVPKGSVDLVLLYDILHGGYFPEAAQRVRLLRRLRRTLKPGGVLACHLTHVRQFGLTYRRLLAEFRSAGFVLERESRRTLVHDEQLVRGRVFRFRKPRRR